MRIDGPNKQPKSASGATGALVWIAGHGVHAPEGHELTGHNIGSERYVYADITRRRALITTQADLSEPPTEQRQISEREPTAAERARFSMSNIAADRGKVFDGATCIGSFASDLNTTRDGRKLTSMVDGRFGIAESERRIYVFDTTDRTALKFPVVGCYDLPA